MKHTTEENNIQPLIDHRATVDRPRRQQSQGFVATTDSGRGKSEGEAGGAGGCHGGAQIGAPATMEGFKLEPGSHGTAHI